MEQVDKANQRVANTEEAFGDLNEFIADFE